MQLKCVDVQPSQTWRHPQNRKCIMCCIICNVAKLGYELVTAIGNNHAREILCINVRNVWFLRYAWQREDRETERQTETRSPESPQYSAPPQRVGVKLINCRLYTHDTREDCPNRFIYITSIFCLDAYSKCCQMSLSFLVSSYCNFLLETQLNIVNYLSPPEYRRIHVWRTVQSMLMVCDVYRPVLNSASCWYVFCRRLKTMNQL